MAHRETEDLTTNSAAASSINFALPARRVREVLWECGGAPPLLKSILKSKIVVFRCSSGHSYPMPKPATPWPHAPKHQLSENGTYFVTAGTYLKAHHFRTPQRLEVLQRGLLTVTRDFRWELEAWAVFSNHYHFIAHSQSDSGNASSLSQMLGVLHTRTAGWINRVDKTPGRKVWHNFWDTRLTYQKSYLARLNYVHQNAVKHGLVSVANQYRWCSARWFEGVASPAMVRSIYRFKTDALSVSDDFVPVLE